MQEVNFSHRAFFTVKHIAQETKLNTLPETGKVLTEMFPDLQNT